MASSAPTLPGFDYTALTPDIRTNVEAATRRLHDLERRTSESIIEIGRTLIAVKAEIGHGNFLPWIEAEFGWTRMTAHRFISVAESFGEMSQIVTNVSPSALYVLAADSTPKDVRNEFTGLAAIGERVTHKAVQERIAEHKERPRPQRAEPIPVEHWEPTFTPDEDVDEDTGEILAYEQEPIAPPADRARMIAAGLVQANGVAFARRIAAAVYDMTGGNP